MATFSPLSRAALRRRSASRPMVRLRSPPVPRGGASGTGGDRRTAQLGLSLLGELQSDVGQRARQKSTGAAAAGIDTGARRLAEVFQCRGEERARRGQLAQAPRQPAWIVPDQ